MTYIGSRIKYLRKAENITQQQLADAIGIGKSTISMYENGQREPDFETLEALADYFNVDMRTFFPGSQPLQQKSTSALSGEAQNMAIRYQKLDTYGKAAVQAVMTEEELRIREQADLELFVPKAEPKIIPLYLTPAAAGYASPAFGSEYEPYELNEDDPQSADFAIKIQGDSMEPHFPDGSIAFCNRDPIADGDIGVFFVDGDIYCKQYHSDPLGMTYLFSLNRKRADADIVLSRTGNQSFACFGRIITRKKLPLP